MQVKLKSSDEKIFDVSFDVIKSSVTIKTMLEDLGINENSSEIIPLPSVSANILKLIIDFCTHHKDDQVVADDEHDNEKRTDNIESWDHEFLKVNCAANVKIKHFDKI
jgi:S-phase kinase-associated protein 1